MAKKEKAPREALYRLARRSEASPEYSLFVRFNAVLISFLLILIFFLATASFGFGDSIKYLFEGAFGFNQANPQTFINATFTNMSVLLVIALGLAPAYKMKFWNVGAQGQAIMGNLIGGIIVYYLGASISNNFLLLLLALLGAMIGGALWCAIPAIAKSKLGANETLFTLMMNYIAIQIVKSVAEVWKGKNNTLTPFNYGGFDSIFGNDKAWIYIIVILVAIFMFAYLKFTKHGYELGVVGESMNTAKYAGINTTKVIIRTAALSGAICGIAGFIYLATSRLIDPTADFGYGFTSIIVTWSSHFSVLGMGIVAFLIAFLQSGTRNVVDHASSTLNNYASYITVGILLLFLIGFEFFLNFKFVPNSKLAAKMEARRERFRSKHPKFSAFIDSAHLFVKNTSAALMNFIRKLESAIRRFFLYIGTHIKGFFAKLFGKKENKKEGK